MTEAALSRNVAVVTGASEGIGRELAHVFAAHGHDLALVARRRERLEELADEIAASGRPRPLVIALDLAAPDAVDSLAKALSAAGVGVQYLVNNAGFGALGQIESIGDSEQTGMIALNILALTLLTRRFVGQVIATEGGILNVASIAAFAPGPGMAVYYASKAYVLSFSEALAEELRLRHIHVTALCPGPVMTGFQSRAGIEAGAMDGAGAAVLSARATAEAGYDGLMAGRRVVVPGLVNKLIVAAMAWIPHAIMLPLIAARQRRRSQT